MLVPGNIRSFVQGAQCGPTVLTSNQTSVQGYFNRLGAPSAVAMMQCASSSREGDNVSVAHVDGNDTRLIETIKQIEDKWRAKGGDENKAKEAHECAGRDWQQADSGVDVAHRFAKRRASNRTNKDQQGSSLLAFEKEVTTPIAVMELATKGEADKEKQTEDSVYIRWLLADPDHQGGGAALIAEAKNIARNQNASKVEVNAARTAVDWYKHQGFKEIFKQTHQVDGNHCGCVFMEASV